jgi:hypothetical protein
MWRSIQPERLLSWATLGLVLIGYLVYLAWIDPAGYFAVFHDDTLYFSSARALAEGQGYVIPSLPGAPPQTKYPILYSWLLSWVWKFNPSFPGNVRTAVWVTAAFGCWALVASYYLVLSLEPGAKRAALVIVALVAFHQYFLFFSGALLSNIPFMALALTAALAADAGLRREARWGLSAAAGILVGLSVLMRTLGLALVLGFAACAIYRRAFRPLAVLTAAAAPFLLLAAHGFGRAPGPEAAASAAAPGWWQTWLYYTSYTGFWKVSVPDFATLAVMVQANLGDLLKSPAALCLLPLLGGSKSFAGFLLGVALTAGIWAGVLRQARGLEWKPIHFALPFYIAVIVLWNFSLIDSYMLAFLPLLYLGLRTEARHFFQMVFRVWRERRPAAERALAGGLLLAAAVVGCLAARDYVWGLRPRLRGLVLQRAASSQDREQLYEWIRQNTGVQARFVAYEDARLYLATGRQAMWPLALATGSYYADDASRIERQMLHLTDVARHIQARYWVATDADPEAVQPRLAALKTVLPLAFRSRAGKVELYDLACLHHPDEPQCEAVRHLVAAPTAN